MPESGNTLVNLDQTDRAILAALQENARLPVVELARRVNLSPTPCTLRIRRMEQEGVITGYHARLSPLALGHTLMVFVTVSLKSTDEKTLRAFNAAVKPVKQILECHMVGGGFDYLLKIRVSGMGEYRDILGGVLGALPMVESTHSYFVMEEVKESPFLNVSRPKEPRA
ncbi:Lrp/AsnC family transcriptional regulator [Aestuariivirga sp.]|uniref:Lrp/AsnC family transcriptional regulator n=1 Tax=Aestuariivirga sp. TaxID=2650926 RepID=UPI00391B491B